MLLVRPLPPIPRAGFSSRAGRRFLLIEPRRRLIAPAVQIGTIRKAVAAHFAAGEAWDGAADGSPEHQAFLSTSAACEALARSVFEPEPSALPDVFLRAEMLTMHYGDGQLSELLEDDCPAHRMLGGLLQALWKVGGAVNV